MNSICEDLTKVSLDTTITHNCVLSSSTYVDQKSCYVISTKFRNTKLYADEDWHFFCLAYPSSNSSRSRQYCPKVVSRFSLSFLSIYVTYVRFRSLQKYVVHSLVASLAAKLICKSIVSARSSFPGKEVTMKAAHSNSGATSRGKSFRSGSQGVCLA